MKSNKIIIILIGVWILIFIPFFISFGVVCWDGMKMDADKLYESCKVTVEEYEEKISIDKEFCPKAKDFWEATGSCDKKLFVNWELFIPFEGSPAENVFAYVWSAGLVGLIVLLIRSIISNKLGKK